MYISVYIYIYTSIWLYVYIYIYTYIHKWRYIELRKMTWNHVVSLLISIRLFCWKIFAYLAMTGHFRSFFQDQTSWRWEWKPSQVTGFFPSGRFSKVAVFGSWGQTSSWRRSSKKGKLCCVEKNDYKYYKYSINTVNTGVKRLSRVCQFYILKPGRQPGRVIPRPEGIARPIWKPTGFNRRLGLERGIRFRYLVNFGTWMGTSWYLGFVWHAWLV